MIARRQDDGLLIVSLERGDDLRGEIEALALREGIGGAEINAIGAIETPELGYYDLPTKTYLRRTFDGIYELLALQGNLTMRDGKPFLHAHVALGGRDFLALGGHLFDAKIGVVVEMFIRPTQSPLLRIPCDDIGLARWEPNR